MALKRYYINATNISVEERNNLFKRVDSMAFMTLFDMKNIGCVVVYWEMDKDIQEVISFPSGCTVTPF